MIDFDATQKLSPETSKTVSEVKVPVPLSDEIIMEESTFSNEIEEQKFKVIKSN